MQTPGRCPPKTRRCCVRMSETGRTAGTPARASERTCRFDVLADYGFAIYSAMVADTRMQAGTAAYMSSRHIEVSGTSCSGR